jgi:hypothetical protein
MKYNKNIRFAISDTRQNNKFIINTNKEINEVIKGQNIIGFIKIQRLIWLGHVERMTDDNNVKKIKRWKPMSKRPIGTPKTRWEDDVLEDIKSMKICDWKNVAQSRNRWKEVVEQTRTIVQVVALYKEKKKRK